MFCGSFLTFLTPVVRVLLLGTFCVCVVLPQYMQQTLGAAAVCAAATPLFSLLLYSYHLMSDAVTLTLPRITFLTHLPALRAVPYACLNERDIPALSAPIADLRLCKEGEAFGFGIERYHRKKDIVAAEA